MTDTKTVDWGSMLALIAFGFFMVVLLITVGGWVFSIAWNSFVVPVFALPPIDIGQGFAALFMAWAVGSAFGWRKAVTPTKK
jgi:hypothetical protein